MKNKLNLVALVMLSLVLLTSCGDSGSASFDTNFPLPENVSTFTGGGGDADINFQSPLSIDEVVSFYRGAFSSDGMTERTLNTSITAGTASIVFDGHSSGKAVVMQAVDLGDGNTNINVRLEDI